MISRLIAIALSLLLATIVSAADTPAIEIGKTVVKVPIGKGMSLDDAALYLMEEAENQGIQQIAHSALYEEYEALGLSNIRHTEIFLFDEDVKLTKTLIEHDISYAAHIPCRVGLIEDPLGKGWFVMMNPTIFGASSLPPDLQQQSGKTCGNLMKIIGASSVALCANNPSMDIAETAIKMQIAEDVSIDDAIESLLLRANDLNVKKVSHQILTDKYQELGLPNIRRIEIFQFCDAALAQKMLEHEIGYIAYMPCRIVMLEDKEGKGWFVMVNMDTLIAWGKMPPLLHRQAIELRDKLMESLEAGVNGEL
ncbi:MAG: hypothetical protein DRR19_09785 [Candidatus Parabeggiatoa sp. nov. 1]|nr:MAG: hypothetical protein DRR19_09785 [Gammaproteobacteria bacterium]